MVIIAFIGDIGSGKTLSAVKFMFEKFSEGHDIFANLGLKFSENKNTGKVQLLNKEFFNNYRTSEFNVINACVCVDEAHIFLDSRNSLSQRNKIFNKFVTQSRKRTVDLIYTTQDKSVFLFLTSGQVDLRLRKLTDFIVFCKCHKLKNGMKFIENIFCDNYGMIMFKNVWYANTYFNLYDTNEIIDID